MLDDPQVAFVVDFGSRLKSLKRFNNLDGDPFILILNLSYHDFLEPLKTSLIDDGHHAIVSAFELEAIQACKL